MRLLRFLVLSHPPKNYCLFLMLFVGHGLWIRQSHYRIRCTFIPLMTPEDDTPTLQICKRREGRFTFTCQVALCLSCKIEIWCRRALQTRRLSSLPARPPSARALSTQAAPPLRRGARVDSRQRTIAQPLDGRRPRRAKRRPA